MGSGFDADPDFDTDTDPDTDPDFDTDSDFDLDFDLCCQRTGNGLPHPLSGIRVNPLPFRMNNQVRLLLGTRGLTS